MPNNEWKSIFTEPPPMNQDVLIYSTEGKGYAVAMNTPEGIRNSITGQFFGPRPIHWQPLPPAPSANEGTFVSRGSLALAPEL